jgi:hypothetical protein
MESGYHITPAAALVQVEFREIVGAALRASYRGATWFESAAAHHSVRIRCALVRCLFSQHRIGSFLGFGESPAVRVSVQSSDLPLGMTRCPVSGRPDGGYTPPYGANDVWTVIYADSCNVPAVRRYAFSWVLEFPSETAAAAAYKAFVGSQDCTIEPGCVEGLGQISNLNCGPPQGSGQSGCLGTWQRNAFMLTFEGTMSIDEAKKAVLQMDARALTIPLVESRQGVQRGPPHLCSGPP